MATTENLRGEDTGSAGGEPGEPKYPGKGFRLGSYVLGDMLGHGAMATVFLARDDTGHDVALKIFQEGPGVSKTMLERFRREAEASKKLRRHPHIITLYTTGREGPYHFIAMQHVPSSTTLEMALENAPISMKTTVGIMIKIARALQYAHSRNIVHRDVKPSNVMIDEFGEPLLSDFGVAALIDWPSCTVTGALTGTPLYMSPEQARAERVGPVSDVYSLGVVLFEALTGVLPYSPQHCAPVKNVLEAVKHELPKRPRLYRKEISPDLEAVMLKALEKDPADRYVDAEALALDLERALAGRSVSAHHFSSLDRVRHFARQHRYPLLTAAAIVLSALALGQYFRGRLLEAHYENVLAVAWRRSAQYALAQVTGAPGPETSRPRAWQDIRLARNAMSRGNWEDAVLGYQSAAALSKAVGDGRTAAIAQLDQARCRTLLAGRDAARRIYRDILTNPDAPPAVAGFAQLEHLSLAVLGGDREQALDVLLLRETPSVGPIGDAIRCLSGDLPPARLLADIDTMPVRFRNDAYLAATLRYHADGEGKRSLAALKLCAQTSVPPNEWPGPFARALRNEIYD